MDDQALDKPSYELINYSLRPAKAIERRMLCELFGRLYPFQPVDTYSYVGFGAIHFSDFQLIHRQLGITDLTSIEHDKGNEQRFRLNQPYACIKMHFDEASAVLPSLEWAKRHIIWLDYDGALGLEQLADISCIADKCRSGTLLVTTINAHPAREPGEEARTAIAAKTEKPFNLPRYRLDIFKKQLGEKCPAHITTGRELNQENLPKVIKSVLNNEIESQLNIRNLREPLGQKMTFKQVVFFSYKDGAQMMSVGWVFYSENEVASLTACRINELHFSRDGEAPFPIKVPCLTPKEMRHLNASLPRSEQYSILPFGIPDTDISRYSETYRYFPAYTEAVFL